MTSQKQTMPERIWASTSENLYGCYPGARTWNDKDLDLGHKEYVPAELLDSEKRKVEAMRQALKSAREQLLNVLPRGSTTPNERIGALIHIDEALALAEGDK